MSDGRNKRLGWFRIVSPVIQVVVRQQHMYQLANLSKKMRIYYYVYSKVSSYRVHLVESVL